MFAGGDQSPVTDAVYTVPDIAFRKDTIGLGIGCRIVFKQLLEPLFHLLGMGPEKRVGKPALGGGADHRSNAFFTYLCGPLREPLLFFRRAPSDGTDKGEAVNPFRMGEGQQLCDHSAKGKSDEIGFTEASRVHGTEDIGDEILQRAVGGDASRLALPPQIHAEHREFSL